MCPSIHLLFSVFPARSQLFTLMSTGCRPRAAEDFGALLFLSNIIQECSLPENLNRAAQWPQITDTVSEQCVCGCLFLCVRALWALTCKAKVRVGSKVCGGGGGGSSGQEVEVWAEEEGGGWWGHDMEKRQKDREIKQGWALTMRGNVELHDGRCVFTSILLAQQGCVLLQHHNIAEQNQQRRRKYCCTFYSCLCTFSHLPWFIVVHRLWWLDCCT